LKLVSKISLRYLLFSFIALIVSIPVFYVILQHAIFNSVDESLQQHEEAILKVLAKKPVAQYNSFNDNIRITLTNQPVSPARLSSRNIFIQDDQENVTYRILESVRNVNGRNYFIHIRKSLIENTDLIQSIIGIQVGLLIVLLTGLYLINRSLSHKIWKPFYDTVGKLKSFSINSRKTLQLPRSDIQEFYDLNTSLEILSKKAVALYNSQKEFTENASHELQTPLSIILGKLELLMQTSPINEEQAELINSAYNSGLQMKKMNQTLLLLTKIENNQFLTKDDIHLQQSVKSCVHQFEDFAVQKNIKMVLETKGDATIKGNKYLFDIMTGNLLKNAILHSASHSRVNIISDNTEITICNSAEEGSLNKEKLFVRFQKQNNQKPGTGIGLEIASKIASIHNAQINYQYTDNSHCFIICFFQKDILSENESVSADIRNDI